MPMTMMFSFFALAVWFGSVLLTDPTYINSFTGESWNAGDVMRVFFLMFIGGMMLGQAGMPMQDVGKAAVLANKIMTRIDRVPPIDSYSDDGDKPKATEGRIEFRDVSFSYPQRSDEMVFSSLDLVCEAGKRTALVGGSGAGKSTLICLIERFYDVSTGAVLIDGNDVRDLSVKWLRQQMGLVAQEPVLFGTGTRGTIMENVKYGKPDATKEEVYDACREANAHDFIVQLPKGYDTCVGESGTQLSGGQKQRIAIARAVLRDPKILLLDEATSALDTQSEKLVKTALDRIMQGRTTVVVAHRLSTIVDADCICVVEGGRIAERGAHAELMQRDGAYAKLVQRQAMDQSTFVEDGSTPSDTAQVTVTVDEEGTPGGDGEDEKEPLQADKEQKAPGGKKEEKDKEEKEEQQRIAKVQKQIFANSGSSLLPLLWGGMLAAAIVGAQFPTMQFMFAEIINTLTLCAEVDWCDWPSDSALLMRAQLNASSSCLLMLRNESVCPVSDPCPVTWGTSVPFYSEPELCFEELKDEGTAMVKW